LESHPGSEVKTTIEGGAEYDYIERGQHRGSGGGEGNTDSGLVAPYGKESVSASASAQKQKEERGEHIDFRHDALLD
jgi:hypothetical protein